MWYICFIYFVPVTAVHIPRKKHFWLPTCRHVRFLEGLSEQEAFLLRTEPKLSALTIWRWPLDHSIWCIFRTQDSLWKWVKLHVVCRINAHVGKDTNKWVALRIFIMLAMADFLSKALTGSPRRDLTVYGVVMEKSCHITVVTMGMHLSPWRCLGNWVWAHSFPPGRALSGFSLINMQCGSLMVFIIFVLWLSIRGLCCQKQQLDADILIASGEKRGNKREDFI